MHLIGSARVINLLADITALPVLEVRPMQGNRPRGGLPQMQQSQSPTGWAPTKTKGLRAVGRSPPLWAISRKPPRQANRPQGWAPTKATKPIAHRGGLLQRQQNQSPTGWAPTKATKPIAHGVGSYNKGIAQRLTKKGPLVAALFGF